MYSREELITVLRKEIFLYKDDTLYYTKACDRLNKILDNVRLETRGIVNDLEDNELLDILFTVYEDEENIGSKIDLIAKILELSSIDKRLLLIQDIDDDKVKTIFREMLNKTVQKKEEYEAMISKNKRIANNRERIYKTMISYLKENKERYVTTDEILGKLKFNLQDEESYEYLYNFLKIMTLSNKKIYEELALENNKFSNCTQKEIELLFASPSNSLKISNLSKLDKEKLFKYGNIDKIKELLEIRRKYNLSFFDTSIPSFVDVLLYTSAKTFERVCMILLDNNIKTIVNAYIFIDSDNKAYNAKPLYEIFISNISLLKHYKIDISKVSKYDANILIGDPNLLLKQLLLLEKYNIDFSRIFNAKYNSNYEILYSDIFDIADNYIECNEEEYIKKHPFMLKKSMNNISKRVYVQKKILNGSIYEDNDKKQLLPEIFTGNNFIAHDEELDDILLSHYIYSVDENINDTLNNASRDYILNDIELFEMIKVLDKNFKVSPLTYIFDGVIVSRNRFLRNISALIDKYGISAIDKMILPSLIYKSYLTKDEISLIENELENMFSISKIK